MGNFKNLDFLQNYKFTLDFSKIRDIIYALNIKKIKAIEKAK